MLIRRGFKPNQGSGDSGESSLFSLERRWKDDGAFEALGNVDELSSHLGLCRHRLSLLGLFEAGDQLKKIQCVLQDVASHLATPQKASSDARIKRTELRSQDEAELRAETKALSERLPPLTSFILPGGGEAGGVLQIARAVCRRAERSVVPLVREGSAEKTSLAYLNRLSDYLFILARLAAETEGAEELVYKKPKDFQSQRSTKASE